MPYANSGGFEYPTLASDDSSRARLSNYLNNKPERQPNNGNMPDVAHLNGHFLSMSGWDPVHCHFRQQLLRLRNGTRKRAVFERLRAFMGAFVVNRTK